MDTVETQRQQFEAVAGRLGAQVNELGTSTESPQGKQAVQTLQSGIPEWLEDYRQYVKLMAGGDYTSAHDVMLDKIYPLVERMNKAAIVLSTGSKTC